MIYSAIAPFYDRMMSHVEYDRWHCFIKKVLDRHLPAPGPVRIFETGGGTGTLGTLLSRDGFLYTGSDRSPAMCLQARKKGVPFFCADARHLPLKKAFHLIIFLYDGINYLPDVNAYAAFFGQVAAALEPGGLLLFDVTTKTNSLRHFADYVDADDWGDHAWIRHSYFEDSSSRQINDFTVFSRDSAGTNTYVKSFERHEQLVFPLTTIRTAASAAKPLSLVGVFDGYSFKNATDRSERVHFLLKKKGGA